MTNDEMRRWGEVRSSNYMKQRKKGGELGLEFIAVIHDLAKP
jgi:hypothetical protein